MTHEDETSSRDEFIPDDYGSGGYESAVGWEPKDKWAKIREQYRKKHAGEFCRDSMLDTRPANDWMREGAAIKERQPLFGDLWRTGELAVLIGESGVGKSVLAVHLAESIARGRSLSGSPPYQGGVAAASADGVVLSRKPQNVILLDFQHSPAQFKERYSCPSPIPGKLPVRYRFAAKFHRTGYGEIQIPETFKGDLARYFEHSVNLEIGRENARVIIIDNLAALDPKATGNAAAVRRMRSLKLLAMTAGVSILVIHNSPPCLGGVAALRGRGGSSGLQIPRSALSIAESADSVFAIGRSTYGPDIRYIKHLKSISASAVNTGSGSGPVPASNADVLVYQIGRSEGLAETVNRKQKQVNGSDPSPFVRVSDLPALVSGLPSSPVTGHQTLPPGPFLGFEYLGVAAEQELIRDYEAGAEARERSRLKKLGRSSREILVDGILDGSYARYLKGE